MVLGIDDLTSYNFPNISAIRRIELPILQFFKRLDLVFINVWIFSIFCSLSFVVFTTVQYLSKIFTKAKYNLILCIVCIGAFVMGIPFKNAEQLSSVWLGWTTYLGLIPGFIIPLILLITAKVKKLY